MAFRGPGGPARSWRRFTKLDEIKNLHVAVRTGPEGGCNMTGNETELASQGRRLAGAVLHIYGCGGGAKQFVSSTSAPSELSRMLSIRLTNQA